MRDGTTTRLMIAATVLGFLSTDLLADSLDWSRYENNPILSPTGPYLQWPSVVRLAADEYRMWYEDDGAIRLATSTDGRAWTQYASNPVLTHDGGFESYAIGAPCVLPTATGWRMWYTGSTGSQSEAGVADSTDGVHWTKNAGNPVLGLGAQVPLIR